MEAAAAAASAAAKEAAMAASAAAAAAAKEAAVAAANAKEAAAAAKEAVTAASAAAFNAKEAAVTASAAALNAKEAAAVAVAAGEAAASAAAAAEAAMRTSKKRKFHLIDNRDPPESGNCDDERTVDLISRLPDAVLGSIVSLLPTQEGARTQVISRRWRPLWRSAPLNLVADNNLRSKNHKKADLIPKILSEHPGPARRFSLDVGECYDKLEGWLSSQALDNLQEFELTGMRSYVDKEKLYLLPSSAYRFAPTLRVAKFSGCQFSDFIAQLSLKFPCLKQLTLNGVTISEGALRGMLFGCPVLESLELNGNFGIARLCISSETLKSIGFCAGYSWWNGGVLLQELVIEDAPCLERLLPLYPKYNPTTIRIISAPKLKILGMLSEDISVLHFGTTVFQKMVAVDLTTKMDTIRVLALSSAGPNLDAVVNFLKCFPCLERLYVIFQSSSSIGMNNVRKYDPLDPIECLELHLKKLVLKNYDGLARLSIDFAKFFVSNAKVLKEMKIALPYHRRDKWFANQRSLLEIEKRASRRALIELKCGNRCYITHNSPPHDLSMPDPFDTPSSRCSDCR